MTIRLETEADWAELARLEKNLRDLWEGCVPWREAIEMIGPAGNSPDEYRAIRKELRRSWNDWSRRHEASQRAW